ncbi:hypothetical protein C8R43DRAFT_1039188 [Mycena crocata]|nr:hypothetical protein C8R43DRAFT_1039188 [Mycena crocata]
MHALHRLRAYVGASGLADIGPPTGRDTCEAETPRLLPVYFALLDSSHLHEDEWLPDRIRIGQTVFHSLSAIMRHMLVPMDSLEDLWPRLWIWLQFLDRHPDAVSDEDDDDLEIRPTGTALARLNLLSFVSHLGGLPNIHPLISMTRGVLLLVSRLWVRWIHEERIRKRSGLCMMILLQQFIRVRHPHFDEVIDGVGGTHLDLGALVLKHIDIMVSQIHSGTLSQDEVKDFRIVLGELANPKYREAFVVQGIVASILKLVIALWPVHPDCTPYFIHILGKYMQCYPVFPWVVEALDAGLLGLFARWAMQGSFSEAYDHYSLRLIFCRLLPSQMIYYSVVRRVEKVGHDTLIPLFKHPGIRRDWMVLRDLTAGRSLLKSQFDIRGISLKFCGNLKCNNIEQKTSLSRCSRCSYSYYCSAACQRSHWSSGGHRDVCQLRDQTGDERLSAKKLSFIRYIVHNDYTTRKEEIFRLRAEFMFASPRIVPFYTEFDYTSGDVRLSVRPTVELLHQLPSEAAKRRWLDFVLRMGVAAGTMFLDVAVVEQGQRRRICIFPMRSNNSKMHEGILRIVDEKRSGSTSSAECAAALKSLAEEQFEDLLEVHV